MLQNSCYVLLRFTNNLKAENTELQVNRILQVWGLNSHLLNIPIMPLAAAGGKAGLLEFQFYPLGVDKGLQLHVFVPSQRDE